MKKLALALLATTVAAPALAAPMSPAEYVMTACASDLYERTSSQIVLQSTASPAVHDFAQMMLSAHSQSTAAVKTAARQSGLKPSPPQLTPLQAEMIAQLRADTGMARDAAYIAQQRAAHNGALIVQKAYATQRTAPALPRAAGGIVPEVEHHIAILMKMET